MRRFFKITFVVLLALTFVSCAPAATTAPTTAPAAPTTAPTKAPEPTKAGPAGLPAYTGGPATLRFA